MQTRKKFKKNDFEKKNQKTTSLRNKVAFPMALETSIPTQKIRFALNRQLKAIANQIVKGHADLV